MTRLLGEMVRRYYAFMLSRVFTAVLDLARRLAIERTQLKMQVRSLESEREDCLAAFRQIKNLLPSVTNRSDIAWICDRAIAALGGEHPEGCLCSTCRSKGWEEHKHR